MPRPKSYDRDVAIDRACRAFWEHGYGPLGVRAIEVETGLNKFAIRTEFGGKEGLYLAALEYYHRSARETVLQPMREAGIEAIAAFFEGLVTEGSVNSSAWGCLMVNTGIENAEIRSPALKQAAEAYWAELRDCFQSGLSRNSLIDGLDVEDAARGMVAAVMGIHTMNRVYGAHDAGRPLVQMILEQLRTWRAADA